MLVGEEERNCGGLIIYALTAGQKTQKVVKVTIHVRVPTLASFIHCYGW